MNIAGLGLDTEDDDDRDHPNIAGSGLDEDSAGEEVRCCMVDRGF